MGRAAGEVEPPRAALQKTAGAASCGRMGRLILLLSVLASGVALAVTPDQIAAALALREAGRPAEAQAALEQLAAAEPRHPEVNYQLGVLAYLRDDTEAAIRHLETALASAPGEARYHYHFGHAQGRSAQKAGRLEEIPLLAPYRLDECGWVANRWAELLPLPAGLKADLLAADDALERLQRLSGYLEPMS